MPDFTVEQLETMIENLKSLKEGATEGPWKVRRDEWGGGLDCPEIVANEDNLRLAAAAPDLVDESIRDKRALIAEKKENQRLREGLKELQEMAEFGQGSAAYDKFHAVITRIVEAGNG